MTVLRGGLPLASALLLLCCSGADETEPWTNSGGGSGQGAAGTGAGSTGGAGTGAGGSTSGSAMVSCLQSCEAQHPQGRAALGALVNSCLCDLCQPTCDDSCQNGVFDDACTNECLVHAVHGGHCSDVRFQCQQDEAVCGPYYNCFASCLRTMPDDQIDVDQARQICTDRINDYRSLEGKALLARQTDQESCADDAAEMDSAQGAHASFGMCSESSQCECWGLNSNYGQLQWCLELMYMEKYTGEQNGGHYQAMVNTAHTAVACGFFEIVGTQNYY